MGDSDQGEHVLRCPIIRSGSPEASTTMELSFLGTACMRIVADADTTIHILWNWIGAIEGLDDTIAELIREPLLLRDAVESLRTYIGQPDVAATLRKIKSSDLALNSLMWTMIGKLISQCGTTMHRYGVLLQLADDTHDRVKAIGKCLNEPRPGIGSSELFELKAQLQNILPSLNELVAKVKPSAEAMSREAIDKSHQTTQPLAQAMQQLVVGATPVSASRTPPELPSKHGLSPAPQPSLKLVMDQDTAATAQGAPASTSEDWELRYSLVKGSEQGRRVVPSWSPVSQRAILGTSIAAMTDPRLAGSTVVPSVISFQPTEHEEPAEIPADSGMSVLGAPVTPTAQISIENWIVLPQAVDVEESRVFARSLILRAEECREARNWKQAAQNLELCLTEYVDFLEVDGKVLSTFKHQLAILRYKLHQWVACIADFESLLIDQTGGEGEEENLKLETLDHLSRACYYAKRSVDGKRYCRQGLQILQPNDSVGSPKEQRLSRLYSTMVLINDASLNFAESQLWFSKLPQSQPAQDSPSPLSLADFWERHLLVQKTWIEGDIPHAVNLAMRFISEYLMELLASVPPNAHHGQLTANFEHHGNMGLAACGRGAGLVHLLACDGKRPRWREIALLLREGADLNAKTDFTRQVPLHCSIFYKSLATTSLLLEAEGVNVNVVDYQGHSPFMTAVMIGSRHDIDELISFGADPYFTVPDDGDPGLYGILKPGTHHLIELATISCDRLTIARMLAEKRQPPQSVLNSSAVLACTEGHDDLLSLLILEGGVSCAFEDDGKSLLHTALIHGKPEIFRMLVDQHCLKGLPIRNDDKPHLSPLNLAVLYDLSDIARDLMLRDTTVNGQARHASDLPDPKLPTKESLLLDAVRYGTQDWVRVILGARADVNKRMSLKDWPLLASIKFARPEMLQLLVDAGANDALTDAGGRDIRYYLALMYILAPPDLKERLGECLKLLNLAPETFGRDFLPSRLTQDESGSLQPAVISSELTTAVTRDELEHVAVSSGDREYLRHLMNRFPAFWKEPHLAKRHLPKLYGVDRLLFRAASRGKLDLVREILEFHNSQSHRALVNPGLTTLCAVAAAGSLTGVACLLAAGVKVGLEGSKLQPLVASARHVRPAVMERLLGAIARRTPDDSGGGAGAGGELRDLGGWTAVFEALSKKWTGTGVPDLLRYNQCLWLLGVGVSGRTLADFAVPGRCVLKEIPDWRLEVEAPEDFEARLLQRRRSLTWAVDHGAPHAPGCWTEDMEVVDWTKCKGGELQ